MFAFRYPVSGTSRLLKGHVGTGAVGLALFACADSAAAQAQHTITVGPAPPSVVIADWNGDGHPDLAVPTEGDRVVVLLGDGTGDFAVATQLDAGSNPVDLAAADLDEDGQLDLAVANHETDYVSLLRGDGAGGFQPFSTPRVRPGFAPHPHAVVAADMNGDGHVDLLVDDRNAEDILLLRGDGTGRFADPPIAIDVGGDPYRGMAVADLDGDGALDIVTPNPREAGVVLNERGQWRRIAPVPATAPFVTALADLNDDATLDLVTGAESGPTEIRFGLGRGRFPDAPDWERTWGRGAPNAVVGDFDGDGIDDVVVSSYFTTEVLVVFGGKDGLQTRQIAAGTNPWGMAAGNLNSDGRDDLIVADSGSDVIRIFLEVGR